MSARQTSAHTAETETDLRAQFDADFEVADDDVETLDEISASCTALCSMGCT